MAADSHSTDVFINCPFDRQFQPVFEAIVFAVSDCGFRPRCAMEIDDSARVRIDKIFQIIAECRYGVHDLSRTDPDPVTGLPRFNMPLELGMFLAARRFGTGRQKLKACLVLDSQRYRYQQFISDIAGQDIHAHENDPAQVIRAVRNWLRSTSQRKTIPGGAEIHRRYQRFQSELPDLAAELRIELNELTFVDFTTIVETWLRKST